MECIPEGAISVSLECIQGENTLCISGSILYNRCIPGRIPHEKCIPGRIPLDKCIPWRNPHVKCISGRIPYKKYSTFQGEYMFFEKFFAFQGV